MLDEQPCPGCHRSEWGTYCPDGCSPTDGLAIAPNIAAEVGGWTVAHMERWLRDRDLVLQALHDGGRYIVSVSRGPATLARADAETFTHAIAAVLDDLRRFCEA